MVVSIKKYKFGEMSLQNLAEVHPDLQRVAARALELSSIDFAVTDGLRTQKEQEENIKNGVSQTRNSRHLDGHAIDVVAIVDGRANWQWNFYEQIATAFKRAASELGVVVEWGGDWKSFKDGCHFQLSRKTHK